MRKVLAIVGALSMVVPAAAWAQGHGHGNGHGNGGGHGRGHDYDHGRGGMASYGCPPGLAKRGNGCLPPGQARRAYWAQGARVPVGYSSWSRYDAIPTRYRDRVPYNADYRYVYRDNYVYTVDPQTRLVQSVIDLLRR